MMKRTLLLALIAITACTSAQAINITSQAPGAFTDTSTWDCSCIPTSADNVFVLHEITVPLFSTANNVTIMPGGKISTVNVLNLFGGLNIMVGAEMDNDGPINVRGPYVLNGLHSGIGIIRMRGSTLEGTGIMANTKDFELRDGDKTVLTGSSLDLTSIRVRLYGTVRLINRAYVKIKRLGGTGNNIIVNETNAKLEFTSFIPAIKLFTEGPGNEVTYSAPPSTNQFIRESISGYERLVVRGNLTGFNRSLGSDIVVNGALVIQTVQLDASNGSNVFDITMNGDWINESGVFVPRDGLVNFSGRGNTIKHFNDKETFYQVEFSGNTSLQTKIEVTDLLTLTDTLDQRGKLVQIEGDWFGNGGTLSDTTGLVAFTGPVNSSVSGLTSFNNVSITKDTGSFVEVIDGFMLIWETLSLANGKLVTNDKVQIPSGPYRTGRVGRVTNGGVDGEMYIYRYTFFADNGWHNICAPVQGMTLDQWNNDFITTGFPGSDFPDYNFINITKYDETVDGHKDIGFNNVSSITESVDEGTGVRAYLPGYYSLFEVKGNINIGPFDFPISYTPTSGGMVNDGWNLIANPYASTIDWDSPTGWTKIDMENAVYVWDYVQQQYASYVDGVGTNGGSPFIPSSQAFWVQSTANTSSLQINEFAKTTSIQVYRSPEYIAEHLTLKMKTSNDRKDEVAFRFKDEATRDYNKGLDAIEFRSTDEKVPSIAFVSENGIDCSIYSISEMREEVVLPITLNVGVNGAVEFSCDGYASFANLGLHILDASTGVKYPLSETGSFSIELDADEYVGRFFLIRATADENSSQALTSEDNGQQLNEGIDKTLPSQSSDINAWFANDVLTINSIAGQKLVDVSVYDLSGKLIESFEKQTVDSRLELRLNSAQGLLIVEITDRANGQVFTTKVMN